MEHDLAADDSTAAMITDGHPSLDSQHLELSQFLDSLVGLGFIRGEINRESAFRTFVRVTTDQPLHLNDDDEEHEDILNDAVVLRTFLLLVITELDHDNDDDDDILVLDGGGGGFRGVPASAAAVAGLQKRLFEFDDHHGGGRDNDDGEAKGCVICMEEFVAGDEVSAMPCSENHSFHRHCIAEWLGRSNVCPLCRHALPAEE